MPEKRGQRLSDSGADADAAPLEADHVADLELPAATAIDLAVDRDEAVDDRFLHISAGVEEPCELEELPEADHVAADGDVDDRSRFRHPGMLTDESARLVESRDPAYHHSVSRIFGMSFASVYPLYIAKVERKGRTKAELDEVIEWLTGFDDAELARHLDEGTTFEAFFADARLNRHAELITGTVCGVRVQEVEDPLMRKIRYLDLLVDELARGKAMGKILRAPQPA